MSEVTGPLDGAIQSHDQGEAVCVAWELLNSSEMKLSLCRWSFCVYFQACVGGQGAQGWASFGAGGKIKEGEWGEPQRSRPSGTQGCTRATELPRWTQTPGHRGSRLSPEPRPQLETRLHLLRSLQQAGEGLSFGD